MLTAALSSDLFVAPVLADRTRRAIAAGRPDARVGLHRLIVVSGCGFALASLAALLLGGSSLHEIGFGGADLGDPAVQPLFLGMLIGCLAPLVTVRLGARPPVIGDLGLLLPQTPRERRSYAAAAVSAGVTEEITYRALPVLLFLHLLPGDDRLIAVVATAALFGLAHRYQGPAGMAITAVVGLVLGGLYVLSGSLWPSVLIHVLLDLRLLLVRPGFPAGRGTGGPA